MRRGEGTNNPQIAIRPPKKQMERNPTGQGRREDKISSSTHNNIVWEVERQEKKGDLASPGAVAWTESKYLEGTLLWPLCPLSAQHQPGCRGKDEGCAPSPQSELAWEESLENSTKMQISKPGLHPGKCLKRGLWCTPSAAVGWLLPQAGRSIGEAEYHINITGDSFNRKAESLALELKKVLWNDSGRICVWASFPVKYGAQSSLRAKVWAAESW